MKEKYATCNRLGFFGGNKSTVKSVHATVHAAINAAKKHTYTDEQGQHIYPVCVVGPGAYRRGSVIWGDMFPEIKW